MKPTNKEVLDLVREHFGLSLTEVMEVLKTPLHPTSLRDEFAMAAMQGMHAHPDCQNWTEQGIAESSYRMADAMLKVREEHP